MTTSASDRAKEAIDKLCFCDSELRRLIGPQGIDIIAAAISQAENEKLEEACASLIEAARPKAFGGISVGDELNMQAAAWAASQIRSLKTPKD